MSQTGTLFFIVSHLYLRFIKETKVRKKFRDSLPVEGSRSSTGLPVDTLRE